ncbi:non-specific lipid transfer protein GPI-anchored 11-like isoform X2 [Spinacia oleracea]|uniref:Non-specific lipid transfer protein GPI-anchored 11-like isoform X2 n=1 Tax=Spinacia oleracea TaxID=3562 RepID=A0A9R0K6H2_SPIOL|nr:non-specific lipid transfer protein GPI-anchored 11-like isoform X2 [Spinacia oleracea]
MEEANCESNHRKQAKKQGKKEREKMAISSESTMWVVVILGLISVGSLNVKGQSPAMAPAPDSSGTDCMTLVYTMADCLTYVENGSKLAKPDKACCPEVAGVLKANPICLCEMLSKSKDFSLDLDLNRTLHLPSICKLQTPDVSLCSAAGYPVAGGPTSSAGAGPSSAMPGGMSPGAAAAAAAAAAAMSPGDATATTGKNGASSNVHFNAVSVVAGLAMAFTFLKL